MSSIRQSERLQGQRLERQHGATAARAGARRAAAAQQQQQHQLQQHETTRRRRRCSGGGSGGYGACSRLVLLAALLLACCAAGAGPAAALQQQPSPAPADAAARTRANRQLEALDAALPGAAAAGGPAAAAKLQEVHEAPRITIEEQLQQAEALNVQLTQEQLARANPLLGTAGRLKDPERKRPADWPDGCVVCMYVCAAALAGGPGGCFGFSAACLFLDHAGLNTVVHTTQQHITSITHTHTHTINQSQRDSYFAICAIIKNQHGAHLREWIEYHRFIGTRKIYIYDNNSTVRRASDGVAGGQGEGAHPLRGAANGRAWQARRWTDVQCCLRVAQQQQQQRYYTQTSTKRTPSP